MFKPRKQYSELRSVSASISFEDHGHYELKTIEPSPLPPLTSSRPMSDTTEDEIPGKTVQSTKQSSLQCSLMDIDFGTVSPSPTIGVSISDVRFSLSPFVQLDIVLL